MPVASGWAGQIEAGLENSWAWDWEEEEKDTECGGEETRHP